MAKQKIYDPQAWTDGCILDSNNEPEVANALGCDVEDLKTELTRQMNAEFAKELKK